ncbi:MAG: hypothetical protein GC178_15730 [Flavobacteriales bacterium]|nr:hypothetical protein [Flavobacteriales bacterium]
MKRRLLQLFSVASLCVMLDSCSTTSISKLEGDWQLCWINDLTDKRIYIWHFEGGELTIRIFDPDNPFSGGVVGGRAQYKTSAEFLDAVVEISGFVQSISDSKVIPQISNGKWTIDKIDKEVMRLATTDQAGSGGSYVIREFARPDSDKTCVGK